MKNSAREGEYPSAFVQNSNSGPGFMHELFLLIAMMAAVLGLMAGLGYFFRGWMAAREVALKEAGRTDGAS